MVEYFELNLSANKLCICRANVNNNDAFVVKSVLTLLSFPVYFSLNLEAFFPF